jgi:hypothetical protein
MELLMKRMLFCGVVGAAAVLAACGGGSSGSGAAPSPTAEQPVVISVPTAASAPAAAASAPPVSLAKPLSATFPRPPAPASVNPQTAYLMGPDGQAVEGTLAINETAVEFTPKTVLSLATRYTFVLTTALKDTAGNALLTENKTASFTTRDGQWTEPEWIAGTAATDNGTLVSGMPGVDVDPQGNAVVAWAARESSTPFATRAFARRFDRATNTWGPETLLSTRQDANLWAPRVSAAGNGDFAIYWEDFVRSETDAPAWYTRGAVWGARYVTAQGGWQAATLWAGDYTYSMCCHWNSLAMGPSGDGWFMSQQFERSAGRDVSKVLALPLNADGTLGAPTTLAEGVVHSDPALGNSRVRAAITGTPLGIDAQGRTYVSSRTIDDGVDPLIHPNGRWIRCNLNRHTPGQGWAPPQVVQDAGYPFSCGIGDIRVGPKGHVLSLRFSGPSRVNQPTTTAGGSETWVNMQDPQRGWIGSVQLHTEPNEDSRGTMMDVDGEGNAIVLWIGYGYADASRSGMRFAKFTPGVGWSAPQSFDFQGALPANFTPDTTYFKFDAQGNGLVVFQLHDTSRPAPNAPGYYYNTSYAAVRYLKGQGWQKPHIFRTGDTVRTWYLRTFGIDAAGRAMLAWSEQQADGKWGVRVTRFE